MTKAEAEAEAERHRVYVLEMQVRWFAGYIERQARRVLKDFG